MLSCSSVFVTLAKGMFIFVCVGERRRRLAFENCLGMCAEGGVIDRPDAINLSPTDTLKISGKNPPAPAVSL